MRNARPAQVLHSISSQRLEVVESLESHVDRTVLPILKDVGACWQPTDFLPDSSSPDFVDEVRRMCEGISSAQAHAAMQALSINCCPGLGCCAFLCDAYCCDLKLNRDRSSAPGF